MSSQPSEPALTDEELDAMLQRTLQASQREYAEKAAALRVLGRRIERLRAAVGDVEPDEPEEDSPPRARTLGYVPRRNQRIADWFREHGNEPVTVNRIADEFGWDRRATRACINNHTEMFLITREVGALLAVSLKERKP